MKLYRYYLLVGLLLVILAEVTTMNTVGQLIVAVGEALSAFAGITTSSEKEA